MIISILHSDVDEILFVIIVFFVLNTGLLLELRVDSPSFRTPQQILQFKSII